MANKVVSFSFSLHRGRAYAQHADLLWMETAKPNLPEARAFAEGIHAAVPHQKLAYNLSPSFNWDAAGMSKQEMAAFNRELGRLGFVWQASDAVVRQSVRTSPSLSVLKETMTLVWFRVRLGLALLFMVSSMATIQPMKSQVGCCCVGRTERNIEL